MPHGGPDWGIAAPSSYVFPIVSWEDYFLRSGLTKTMDGNGDIIFFDSFEGGLSKWHQEAAGAIEHGRISAEHSRGGNWSAELRVGAAGGSWRYLRATIPVDAPNRFGAEFNFTLPDLICHPQFQLYYHDFTYYYPFSIRYDGPGRDLQYWDETGAWVDFATFTWERSPEYYFHPVKLVIDATKLEYVKFIARGTEYDLTGKKTTATAQTARRAIVPGYHWQNVTPIAKSSFLDDVIITTNEP